jgi:hypothetical protein
VTHKFKQNPSFVLALDIFARPGKRPVLIAVDKQTADYSIYELGDDATTDLIAALEREIKTVEEVPVAVETDNAICFCAAPLQQWLGTMGIEHRNRPIAPIVEALIRQHSADWGAA